MRALRLSVMSILSVCGLPGALLQYQGGDTARGTTISVRADGVRTSTFAGAMNIMVADLYQRTAFCVDWDTFVNESSYQVGMSFPDTVRNGTRVAWLLENMLSTITAPARFAGLQLAIWDIVHDNGDGMTAGRLRYSQSNLTDPVLVATNEFLAASLNRYSMNAVVYTHVNGKSVTQQFMGAWPGSGPAPVPEPGTIGLAALILAALAMGKSTRWGVRSTVEPHRK